MSPRSGPPTTLGPPWRGAKLVLAGLALGRPPKERFCACTMRLPPPPPLVKGGGRGVGQTASASPGWAEEPPHRQCVRGSLVTTFGKQHTHRRGPGRAHAVDLIDRSHLRAVEAARPTSLSPPFHKGGKEGRVHTVDLIDRLPSTLPSCSRSSPAHPPLPPLHTRGERRTCSNHVDGHFDPCPRLPCRLAR